MEHKVTFLRVIKKYKTVTVDADSQSDAINKAKSLRDEDFDSIESSDQDSWEAKKEWSWLDLFVIKKKVFLENK